MKIFSNPAPQSTERVVQLVGKADAVAAGVKEVLDLIRQVIIEFYPPLPRLWSKKTRIKTESAEIQLQILHPIIGTS